MAFDAVTAKFEAGPFQDDVERLQVIKLAFDALRFAAAREFWGEENLAVALYGKRLERFLDKSCGSIANVVVSARAVSAASDKATSIQIDAQHDRVRPFGFSMSSP